MSSDPDPLELETPLCLCGCGKHVELETDEYVLSHRPCACGCGGKLDRQQSRKAKYLPRHRQRRYQRVRDQKVRRLLAENPDPALPHAGTVKKTLPVAPAKPGGVSRKRNPTRYLVAAWKGDRLVPVDVVEAHDRDAAKREAGGGDEAIPVRSLERDVKELVGS